MKSARRRSRQLARHAALAALSASWRVTGRTDHALARPRVHFVYLHAVPPHEEDRLHALLTNLSAVHEFLGYSEAVDRLRRGPIDRPYVCFSFDDAFSSCRRAAEILQEYGTTGCFFVPPGFIGCSEVAEARRFFRTSQGVDEPALSWKDLERMQSQGHEVGSHTMSHFDLATLDEPQMHDEIFHASELLRKRLGSCRHFAWPLGRFAHFTPVAAETVFGAGHTSCASAERGAHVVRSSGDRSTVCIRRDHVSTSWPVEHSLYLIARSSAMSDARSNAWPSSWGDAA